MVIVVAFVVLLLTFRSQSVSFSSAIASLKSQNVNNLQVQFESIETGKCQHKAAAAIFHVFENSILVYKQIK